MAAVMNGNARRSNRLRVAVWGTAAVLLLLPLIAMRFTSEVNWEVGDFLVMGVLLGITCSFYELGVWLSSSTIYRAAFATAVLGGFLLVWINLAVGMVGDGPFNLWFAGVLVVGIVGALIARFRAAGMVRTLLAMAVAQASIAGYALVTAMDPRGSTFSLLFAGIWLVSAALFHWAARNEARVAERTERGTARA